MDAVERFAELVARDADDVDLAIAALTIGSAAYPDLDLAAWLAEIDAMATGVSDLESLRARLFGELGFTGNTADYYEADNSFLHRVIERRTGIPITLSVLMIEVGRCANVRLEGVGMPGHFLVREPTSGTIVDPFDGGRILDMAACEGLFRASTGSSEPFGREHLPVADSHDILARMLANLKGVYTAQAEPAQLEWVVRMRLALPNVDREETLELAKALAMQGRFRDGAIELESLADTLPAELAAEVRRQAYALRARLN